MVSAFPSGLVRDVSPTTCGPVPFARSNLISQRRQDTVWLSIESHAVWANLPTAILCVALLFLATACGRSPEHESQAKLLFRWTADTGAGANWISFSNRIASAEFTQSALRGRPELAASISKAEIKVRKQLAVILVSASTTEASLEAAQLLMDAVSSAAKDDPMSLEVAVVSELALLE